VASHDENGKEQLADTEKLSSKGSQKYISCVGQILNVRICLMELPDDIASICSKETETDD
jgi:hypothetical protein